MEEKAKKRVWGKGKLDRIHSILVFIKLDESWASYVARTRHTGKWCPYRYHVRIEYCIESLYVHLLAFVQHSGEEKRSI